MLPLTGATLGGASGHPGHIKSGLAAPISQPTYHHSDHHRQHTPGTTISCPGGPSPAMTIKSQSHVGPETHFFHSPPFATVRFELGFTPVRSRGRLAESPRFAVIRLIGCQMGVKPADQMFEASRGLPPREPDREVRPGVRLRPAILLVRVPTRSATFRAAVWPSTPGPHNIRTARTCL